MRMTKKDVVASFRKLERLSCKERIQTSEEIALQKELSFNDYVDSLNKDGLVTDYQAYNWSNPF